MILVAGGTGALGKLVVRDLVAAGERLRVLTRDRERARDLPPGVEVVVGDVRRKADVDAAVRGCSTVVSAVHGFVGTGNVSPETIDRDGNALLIAAARELGVRRFVLVSVHGASATHPMSLHRAKHAAEEMLRASGPSFAIVRPTAFLETWIGVIGGTLHKDGSALVLGPGTNPINFVSVRDVANVVVRCVRDGASPAEIVEVGGPENLGFVDVAQRLIRAKGAGRIKHVPLPALRVMSVLARPFSPAFARQAKAAVVMNTERMSFDAAIADRAKTTLDDVLAAASAP